MGADLILEFKAPVLSSVPPCRLRLPSISILEWHWAGIPLTIGRTARYRSSCELFYFAITSAVVRTSRNLSGDGNEVSETSGHGLVVSFCLAI